MEKITRKKFIELIKKGEHVFCGSVNSDKFTEEDTKKLLTDNRDRIAKMITENKTRTVIKEQSNGLQFTGGSWITFQAGDTYFQENNVLVARCNDGYFTMVYGLKGITL